MKNRTIIYDDYLKVVNYFNSKNDNKTTTIAKMFDLSINTVSYYIDVYLSLKSNYMGAKIEPPTSALTYKKKLKKRGSKGSEVEIYENDYFVCKFESILYACEYLNVNYTSVCKAFKNNKEVTIKHRSINKRITYKKLV